MNTQRKSPRHEQLKSYLTEKPSRRSTASILHPQNRHELLDACRTIACVGILALIVMMIFIGADILGSYHGKV